MSLRNNKGFSLIEVMVAILIILVGLLGLLQAVNVAMEHNLKNQQREEVVRVAEDFMNGMRSQPFDATFVAVTSVTSRLRNRTARYTVNRTVGVMPTGSKQYQVDVRWTYKGNTATHSIVTVRGVK